MPPSVSKSTSLEAFNPIGPQAGAEPLDQAVANFEKNLLLGILEQHRWQKNKAASALQIDRKTLFRKMKKYGLL
jgi:DNA-binding NtrC family response regulator